MNEFLGDRDKLHELLRNKQFRCPDSSGVEHLHGKQAVVGSIPTLGKLVLFPKNSLH